MLRALVERNFIPFGAVTAGAASVVYNEEAAWWQHLFAIWGGSIIALIILFFILALFVKPRGKNKNAV